MNSKKSANLSQQHPSKSSSSTGGGAGSEAMLYDKQHFIVPPLLVYEAHRSLIKDDVLATHKLTNPSSIQEEQNSVMHATGLKKRTIKKGIFGVSSQDNDDEDLEKKGLGFKICCCCCYLGKKHFGIGFGWMIMAVIIIMLFGVAFLKFGENIWYVQSVYDLEKIDYYNVLDIKRDATVRDIKRAHRQMVLKWHPDKNPECGDECVTKMAKITEAYIVLSNDETRTFHDTYDVKPPEKMIQKAREQQHSKKKKSK